MPSSHLCGSGRLKAVRGRCHPFPLLIHQRSGRSHSVVSNSGSVQALLLDCDDDDDDTEEPSADRTTTNNDRLMSYTKRMAACSARGNLLGARKLFDEMPFRDAVAYNIMIRDCIRSGRIEHARDIFDGMPGRTTVSWNSMIMGYSTSSSRRRRKMHLALKLFVVMPDHRKDAFSWSTIISGLARDGRVADSLRLFGQAPRTNPVAWACLLSCFQRNGLPREALVLFKEMLSSLGTAPPAPHSFTSALAAAADFPSLFLGRQLYSHVLRRGLGSNARVGNSVLSMFMKSGSLDGARVLFQYHMPRRDLCTWNSMITGLGRHGLGDEALSTFHLMQRLGLRPDAVSFLGVLQACSHCGRVNEGRLYLDSMQRDFNICPQPEHHVCLVDMLARAGLLREAVEVMSDMPLESGASPVLWRALLNGCRISGELELGLCVANRVLQLEPDNATTCLIMAAMGTYKAAGRWAEVAMLGESMKVRRGLGYSWVEIEGKPHLFTARDETHGESDNIYMILDLLTDAMATPTSMHVQVPQHEHDVLAEHHKMSLHALSNNTVPSSLGRNLLQ